MSTPTRSQLPARRTVLATMLAAAATTALTGCGKTTYFYPSRENIEGPFTADTGLPKLRLTKIGSARGAMLADDYALIFGPEVNGRSNFAALDIATGKTRWQRQAVAPSDVTSDPNATEAVKAVGVGATGRVITDVVSNREDQSWLVARDAERGTKVWQRKNGGRLEGYVYSDIQGNRTGLALTTSDRENKAKSRLEWIDPNTGATKWQRSGLAVIAIVGSTIVARPDGTDRSEIKANDLRFVDTVSGKDVSIAGMPKGDFERLIHVVGGPYFAFKGTQQSRGDADLLGWICLDLQHRRFVGVEPVAEQTQPAIGVDRTGAFLFASESGPSWKPRLQTRRAGQVIPTDAPESEEQFQPASIINGIMWCQSRAGKLAAMDPSGRLLTAVYPGAVAEVNDRALCVNRDGGAGQREIYRIEKA